MWFLHNISMCLPHHIHDDKKMGFTRDWVSRLFPHKWNYFLIIKKPQYFLSMFPLCRSTQEREGNDRHQILCECLRYVVLLTLKFRTS